MSHVVLGVGGLLGHDGNAALIVDGKLIAASQEERFSRRKHDAAFPRAAALDCLRFAGLTAGDVTHCAFAEKPFQSLLYDRLERPTNRLGWWLSKVVPATSLPYPAEARRMFPRAKLEFAWHHLSHAAAAFATSPFERAAFLCVDGKGEDISASIGIANAEQTEIRYELAFEDGLGLLYTLVTYFLGFTSFGSEYKVMGLAPYGAPTQVEALRAFAPSDDCGALRLREGARFQWPRLRAAMESLERHLGLEARRSGEPLSQVHVDLAASVQELFEQEILRMAEFARRATGEDDLLFCGGCAQNCVAAGMLRRRGPFSRVFNSPVGGDMGSGLGSALLSDQRLRGRLAKVDPRGFYLGSEPGEPPSEALPYEVASEGGVHFAAARLLAAGKVVGWVRGRMELGARALGARSILADPRVENMQSLLNLKVKFRESFRPFAPAILAEDCGDWFDSTEASDFMQYTAYLLPRRRFAIPAGALGLRERLDFKRCEVPSIVHVDYSARLQTVRQEVHPDFHRLISEFKRLTGVPILINTSFNVSGQPIVRTADEAWQCFRHTDMDFLVLGERLIRNPNDRSHEEKIAWLKQFEAAS